MTVLCNTCKRWCPYKEVGDENKPKPLSGAEDGALDRCTIERAPFEARTSPVTGKTSVPVMTDLREFCFTKNWNFKCKDFEAKP